MVSISRLASNFTRCPLFLYSSISGSVCVKYVEKYDTAYEPNEPEKDDARFVGWYYKGKLWDFDTEITRDITLEAYYWETKTLNKTVYTHTDNLLLLLHPARIF